MFIEVKSVQVKLVWSPAECVSFADAFNILTTIVRVKEGNCTWELSLFCSVEN